VPAGTVAPYHVAVQNLSLIANRDEQEGELPTEKAHAIFFLQAWRRQLLLHQEQGDTEGIDLDRRILDYYLDLYRDAEALAARVIPATGLAGNHKLESQLLPA